MPDTRLPPPGDVPWGGGKDEKGLGKTEKTLSQTSIVAETQSHSMNLLIHEAGVSGGTTADVRYEKFSDGSIMIFSDTNGLGVENIIVGIDSVPTSVGSDFLL